MAGPVGFVIALFWEDGLMCGITVCVALAFGVDVGWRPQPGGGAEFIIQLEPQAIAMLQSGSDVTSDVPPAGPRYPQFPHSLGDRRGGTRAAQPRAMRRP